MSTLKEWLRSGRIAMGTLVNSPDPSITEIAATHFDWVFVDLEHATTSIERVPDIVRAAERGGAVPLVRIPPRDYGMVSPVLDAGAAGVIFPHVETVDDAEAAVSHSKFPPLGDRSAGYGRTYGYGNRKRSELTTANDRVLTVVQIESDPAVRAAREILSVQGVDSGLVGPMDLSLSKGLLEDGERSATAYAHGEVVQRAIDAVAAAAADTDTVLGLPAGDPETIADAIDTGARLVLTGSTYATLNRVMESAAREYREAVPDGKGIE